MRNLKRYITHGWLLSICPLLFSIETFSQSSIINGKVLSSENGAPISNCSVFINNSSKGTITNSAGEFELMNIPPGKNELIVSSIGYETYNHPFADKDLPLRLEVRLKLKPVEMESVTVEPYVKDGWKEWGIFFIKNFIGENQQGGDCIIKNTNAIKFRFSKVRNRLTASSNEPLLILNNLLGYQISYQLEDFYADFEQNTISYAGYPFFKEMQTKRSKLKTRWEKNRRTAYQLSMMHFVRSLYLHDLDSQGFTMKAILNIENTEKKRVKALYDRPNNDTLIMVSGNLVKMSKLELLPADSIHYYRSILSKPDSYEGFGPPLSADSLLSRDSDDSQLFFFNGTVYISYLNTKEGLSQQSKIKLATPVAIRIWSNGNYFPPGEIFTMGYWSKSEKLMNLLPMDYAPK